MQAARQDGGHMISVRRSTYALAMTGSFLVARLHVDLQRVTSAACSTS